MFAGIGKRAVPNIKIRNTKGFMARVEYVTLISRFSLKIPADILIKRGPCYNRGNFQHDVPSMPIILELHGYLTIAIPKSQQLPLAHHALGV